MSEKNKFNKPIGIKNENKVAKIKYKADLKVPKIKNKVQIKKQIKIKSNLKIIPSSKINKKLTEEIIQLLNKNKVK